MTPGPLLTQLLITTSEGFRHLRGLLQSGQQGWMSFNINNMPRARTTVELQLRTPPLVYGQHLTWPHCEILSRIQGIFSLAPSKILGPKQTEGHLLPETTTEGSDGDEYMDRGLHSRRDPPQARDGDQGAWKGLVPPFNRTRHFTISTSTEGPCNDNSRRQGLK